MADNRWQGMEDLSYVRLLEEQLCAHRENVNYALATIVDTDQNTARTQGKMMVYENGAAVGTVGGRSAGDKSNTRRLPGNFNRERRFVSL